ncbi:MAG: tRNA (N(6)-L-threonylcarbamoyladenosine(37)-C(2))-methylthiotransferase MtaB, partial [Ruthenibacterium sp.]
TPAYDMPHQVAESEKAVRSHALQTAADAVRAEIIAAMQGDVVDILLEKPVNNTLFTGYSTTYVPVLLCAPGHKTGEIVSAVLGSFDGERCNAHLR